MKIFISFIIFLAIGIFLAIAEKSLAKRINKTYDHLPARYVFAGVYAAIMAALFFGAYTMLVDQPKGWEYWCMAIAAMGTLANLFLFFRFSRERGNEWVEVLPYTFVAIITALVALAGAAGFWTLFTGFFGRVLFLIYVLAAVTTILAIWYVFAENRQAHDGASVIVIIGVILAAILVFLILPNWNWFGSKDSDDATASNTTEVATDSQNPVAESLGLEDVVSDEEIKQQMQENEKDKDQAKVKQVGFYNLSLQNDGIEDNDFNFGYNRYQEDRDLDWYVENIIADEAKDPAFAAAHMGRTDMNLGTRISGLFYDTTDETACVEQINKVKDQFINDEEYFKVRVAAFQILLRKADKKLVYAEDITDMMYQYPYTTTGVPDVIIKNTEKQKGHIVVFSIKIKGKDVPFLAVRAECGWQPVIKYSEKKKTTTKKTTTTTTTTTTTDEDKNKNKANGTQGELVGKGTGETTNTNNGEGANTSSAEEQNNTGNQTKEETDKILEEKKEINENQKVGGVDDNTSTTATPAPDKNQGQTETNVDNNGDKGTGNGSADEGEPEVYPVALDENGNQIPNTTNNPSGIWEGDVPK